MPEQEYKHLSESDKKLFKTIEAEKDYYESSTQSLRVDEWEEVWKLMTQHVDESQQPFKSRKRLSKARRVVDTLAAFLVAKEPTFNVLPIGEGDDIKAEFMRELLQYQAKQKHFLDLKRQIKIMVKSATLFGVGIGKVSWATILDDEGKVVFDGPRLEACNVLDIFVDPYIGTFAGQKSVIQRFVLTMEELRANKNYKVPKNMKPTYTDGGASTSYDSSRLDKYDIDQGEGDAETQGKVEVWERWTKSQVITIADPKGKPVILRKMKNPYGFIPFVKMDFEIEAIPNRFYGKGAIGPNIKLNKGIDEVLNNIIDNIRISINPMFKRRRGANVDPRQLLSRPGGFIDMDDMNDVDQLITQDTTQSGFKLLQLLNGEWQSGTAISNVRMGVGGSAETATEAGIQQENADVVTNAVKENMEDAIAEIGRLVAKLNVKNMDGQTSIRIFNTELINKLEKMYTEMAFSPEEIERIQQTGLYAGFALTDEEIQQIVTTGKLEGKELSPELMEKVKKYGKIIRFTSEFIDVDVDIEVEADSTMNKDTAVLRKQVNDITNTIARTPDGVQRIDWEEYVKIQAELSGIPGIKKLIKPLPPPPPMLPGGPAGMPQGVPPGPPPGTVPPQIDQMNTERGIEQSINQGAMQI